MLPKPEKTKKSSVNSEQLSLVDPVKKENNLKKKRLYVGLTLSLTVVLSISFSSYRYFKNNGFAFQLPTSIFKSNNSSSINNSNVDKNITSQLSSEKNLWYVYAKDLTNGFEFNWSKNQANFTVDQNIFSGVIDQLQKTNSNSSLLSPVLPGGVTYSDSKLNQNGDLAYATILTVPNKNIFVYIKVSNGNNLDQNTVNPKIAKVTESLYWFLVNQN